jgi:methyl-accepting chemotaxis protein
MATATAALAAVAITEARHHAALTQEFESANAGTLNVGKLNGLIYAVVMESHGVYMSSDLKISKIYADGIRAFNKQIAKVVDTWRKSVRGDDAQLFSQFSERISVFLYFRGELARLGTEVSAAAGREWGDNDANPSVRKSLNNDLEQLTKIYSARGAFTLMLAGIGAWVIGKSVVRPIETITRITADVASGNAAVAIPFSARKDEIGAVARGCSGRSAFRTRSRASHPNQMLEASTRLASVAEDASLKTEQATAASAEASAKRSRRPHRPRVSAAKSMRSSCA